MENWRNCYNQSDVSPTADIVAIISSELVKQQMAVGNIGMMMATHCLASHVSNSSPTIWNCPVSVRCILHANTFKRDDQFGTSLCS